VLFRNAAHQRGVELGPYPLEALRRAPELIAKEAASPPASRPAPKTLTQPFAQACRKYSNLFNDCGHETPLPLADLPKDLERRSREVKGAAYYLDADHAGICRIPASAWYPANPEGAPNQHTSHTHALVIWVRFGRSVQTNPLASSWLGDAAWEVAHMRALEIGASLAGHMRALGFSAQLHHSLRSDVDMTKLAVLSGIAQRYGEEAHSPFFGSDYAPCIVTSDYPLAVDTPCAPPNTRGATVNPLRQWWGINGATSGREWNQRANRPAHLSRYPMERVTRVEQPTTLIFDDEVPRVPKRAEFFFRARSGDLGTKAQKEVARFAFKHPLTDGMMHPLRAMVPHQNGPVADTLAPGLDDSQANTNAIAALSYHLGADLTGICEIPNYAWYSHGPDGNAIETQHRYAVVMLIDQGFDTMEGASGDDWISGCQSMRGYIRGAEIAGVMADFLRSQGVSARAQTNADSEVLHIPLVLLAGLGELSRIGELVLNPYVGPRFKSVVLTTNLPLVPDQPIDFGLQEFCSNCLKCARECPVSAIPFGDKVVFNGYEIWKPDVERCTRYRVTNPKGSACGRCMKTCPLNKVVDADGSWLHRVGTWLGVTQRWLKPILIPLAVWLDDRIGFGKRNPIKRWWLDLEIVEGRARAPRGTNERDLDIEADTTGAKTPVGYYPANTMPPPNATTPVAVNHKSAVSRADQIETVQQAKSRRAKGQPPPAHYIPTQTLPTD